MKRLILTFALLLTATAAAHAQAPTGSPTGSPNNDSLRNAMRLGDEAKIGEATISTSRSINVRTADESAPVSGARREPRSGTFDANIEVTNSAAKTIKAIEWTATLIDHETGAIIRSYDVTSKTNIAPGKTKKLSKQLTTPRAHVVQASSPTPNKQVADLKVKVTAVTYTDGSTSTTP